ncbi:MAG: YitT family protein [Erysipelotrichaceae bacterium]
MRNLMLILIGNLLIAIASGVFILPNHIVSGGVNGIALVLQPIFRLPTQVMINILIGLTFIAGFIFLGKEFAVKTVISSLIYPLYLDIILKYVPSFSYNIIIATIISGLMVGVGIGLVLRAGASTGGMDIPPIIINKFTGIKISKLVLIMDSTTVILGFVFYGWKVVLMGLLSVFLCSKTLEYTLVVK